MAIVGTGWTRYNEGTLTDKNVAIIGAGKMGYKRAKALQNFDDCKLKTVVDISIDAAKKITDEFGGTASTKWEEVLDNKDIDIVIVSTCNKFLEPISVHAIGNKKHVLCEKPVGRNIKEATNVIQTAFKHGVIFKVGFNHRYHPAILKAKELFDDGKIGDLFFMRCRYGNGGRPGFEKEWRTNKDLSGGGELLDQGIHVVDLFRCFAGNFNRVFGHINTYFWGEEVEDNAFAMFRKNNGVVAQMHISSTQWKNLFSFEIFGSKGYLTIEGLGGSYGVETLKIGQRKQEGGVPDEEVLTFPGEDISWEKEWKEFNDAIDTRNRQHTGNGVDGYQACLMIQGVYDSSQTGLKVEL